MVLYVALDDDHAGFSLLCCLRLAWRFLIIGTMVRIPAESAGIRRMMADDGINFSVTKLLMISYYLLTCPPWKRPLAD